MRLMQQQGTLEQQQGTPEKQQQQDGIGNGEEGVEEPFLHVQLPEQVGGNNGGINRTSWGYRKDGSSSSVFMELSRSQD